MNPVASLSGQHIHVHFAPSHYFLFGIIGLLLILFVIFKWAFVKEVLSENGKASSKRVSALIAMCVVAFNEVYHVLKQQQFDYNHLVALLVFISLSLGLATVPQILQIWKGQPASDSTKTDDKPKTNDQLQ